MKKIIIAAIAILWGGLAESRAQERREVSSTVRMDTIQIDYKTRYASSFWDNFYIEADFAGRMLMGEEDSRLSFGDRLQPGFGITLGKWFHPDFGIRLNFGGNRLKGWNSGPTGVYAYDDGWVTDFDPVQKYWDDEGVDTQNGYKQELKYYEVNADFLFDLYNVFTKNNRLNRHWTAQGYVGIGLLRTADYHGIEDNVKLGLRLGLIGNYNITSRWGVHLSIGGEITDSDFDGEIGKGNKFAGILTGSVGLSYRIGRQGFRVVRLVPQEQLAELNNAITTIRSESLAPRETVEVIKKTTVPGDVLVPAVIFHAGKNTFNEELQMVNIFHVAQYMTHNPEVRIAVVGNTGGTDDHLARKRAEKVRDILVNRYGISPDRMSVQTYDVASHRPGSTGYEQSVNFTVEE